LQEKSSFFLKSTKTIKKYVLKKYKDDLEMPDQLVVPAKEEGTMDRQRTSASGIFITRQTAEMETIVSVLLNFEHFHIQKFHQDRICGFRDKNKIGSPFRDSKN
jgi:hypothetical protein